MATFRNLSPTQSRVFEQIAINQDGGHHPATLKALLKKGLIESYQIRDADSLFPVRITRYFVPTSTHIEWCAWCAEQLEE